MRKYMLADGSVGCVGSRTTSMPDEGPFVAGQDYKGTDFQDAAATVEDILSLYRAVYSFSELTDGDIYRRFRMVFGDSR
jgi:hypothetical protein